MAHGLFRSGSMLGAAGGALGSAAASICCIGPIGISLLGVQGAIFAAGLKPYRFYLLGASLGLLAFAHWMVWRPTRRAAGASCSVRAGRLTRIVLWSSTGLWGLAVALQFVADWFWY